MNLRRNTVFGALGFGLPTLVLLVAYPLILAALGPHALGVFLLATTIGGTFAFLEFGLTTVTTKFLAEAVGQGDGRGGANAVATSLAFYAALSGLGAAVVFLVAPQLAGWSGAAPELRDEAILTFRLAAVQLVFSYFTGVGVSVFKGLHRFEFAAVVGALQSVLVWGGAYLAVGPANAGIVGAAVAGVVGNAVACFVAGAAALRLLHRNGVQLREGRPNRATLRAMLRLGVFMAANGLASTLTSQVQNFLIAGLIAPVALTITATAVQVVSKINALTSAAFEMVLPVSAALSRRGDAESLRHLRSVYLKALGLSLLLSVSASATLYAVAPPLIRWWLRSEIDGAVVSVLRIYCFGLAINGATPVAYHFLNGIGRPEANTAFMLGGAAGFYFILLLVSPGGLTVEKFAIAAAINLVVNGIVYLVFVEAVAWRRWVVPALRPATEEAP